MRAWVAVVVILYAIPFALSFVLSSKQRELATDDPPPPPIDRSFSIDLPQSNELTIETVEVHGRRVPRSNVPKTTPTIHYFDFSRSTCRSMTGVRGNVLSCDPVKP